MQDKMLTEKWISIRFDRRSCFRPGFRLPGRRASRTIRRRHTVWRAGADYQSNAEILPAATIGKGFEISVDFETILISWQITWSSRREHETSGRGCPGPYLSWSHRRPQRLLGMSFLSNSTEGTDFNTLWYLSMTYLPGLVGNTVLTRFHSISCCRTSMMTTC